MPSDLTKAREKIPLNEHAPGDHDFRRTLFYNCPLNTEEASCLYPTVGSKLLPSKTGQRIYRDVCHMSCVTLANLLDGIVACFVVIFVRAIRHFDWPGECLFAVAKTKNCQHYVVPGLSLGKCPSRESAKRKQTHLNMRFSEATPYTTNFLRVSR